MLTDQERQMIAVQVLEAWLRGAGLNPTRARLLAETGAVHIPVTQDGRVGWMTVRSLALDYQRHVLSRERQSLADRLAMLEACQRLPFSRRSVRRQAARAREITERLQEIESEMRRLLGVTT